MLSDAASPTHVTSSSFPERFGAHFHPEPEAAEKVESVTKERLTGKTIEGNAVGAKALIVALQLWSGSVAALLATALPYPRVDNINRG